MTVNKLHAVRARDESHTSELERQPSRDQAEALFKALG